MIMSSLQFTNDKNLRQYTNTLANKMHKGFVFVERNEKLPFTVLSKKGVKVNHSINFMIFCVTLGLWIFPWIYMSNISSKEKKILIAIDEDGNTFEQKCYN